MNVQCGSCPAKYAVPDDKVLGRKVRITCKRCGAAIIVDGTGPSSAKSSQLAQSSRAPASASGAKVSTTPKAEVKPVSATGRAGAGTSAGTSTRPSAAARSALKQTMMGVAPPAPGSAAPTSPLSGAPASANLAPAAVSSAPTSPASNAGAKPGAASIAEQVAAFQRSADRDIKRTMIGGLDAPVAIDNRTAARANQPSVAVPRVQPPAADTTQWTVAVTDDQHEEMPISRIVELFAASTINDETYIWKQGMEDWQMPFDIPEIAAALRKRGFDSKPLPVAQKASDSARATEKMPTAPPPAGMTAAGVWREPGSWNDGVAWKEPALAPGQEHHDVSFDDVTVALAAPQAEALLRDAELAAALDKDEKEEPTAIFPGGAEAPPLSSPRPVLSVPRPAAGRPVPRPESKPTSDAAALAGHPTPPAIAIAIETKPPVAPVAPADPEPASATPASRRATPIERPDLFGQAHRAGSEESQQDEDGAAAGAQKLIGERNESSVLFSLDKVVQTEQQQAPSEKQREEELLGLPTAPPPPGAQALPASLMSAAEEAAIDSALAVPDSSAAVVEKTAPMPPAEPAPASPPAAVIPAVLPAVPATVPETWEEPKPESGSGWLWAVLLLLLAGAAGAIVIFYLRPAALFGSPPAATENAGSALPVPAPAPATSLEPAIAPPASASSAVAPPVASSAGPEPRPRERVEPRKPRDEGSRPIRRERDRKPAEEPSEEPSPSEEQKPPVNLQPPERE